MQKIFSLILFLSFSILGIAQNADAILLNSYSNEEIQSVKTQAPAHYELLIYAIENGTYLSEFDSQKHGSLNLKQLPELTSKPRFTDLKVKIETVNQYFYAPKLNKIVVVKSEWVLNFEKSKEK